MAATIIVIAALATVIYWAGARGKAEVITFYRGRVAAWKGSTPAPAPAGVKAGAAVATAVVGGGLYLRGFVRGVREGWPDGKKAGRDWYAKHLADRPLKTKPAEAHRCPICRTDLARAGWPTQHQNRKRELCPYDWSTDPAWRRCPDCRAILIPGVDECSDCTPRQPATPVQCAHTDNCGKQCPRPADLAKQSIYCTAHSIDDETGPQQRLRLVHNADTRPGEGRTEGGNTVAVETATGGEVHNLEQASAELDAIGREQTAEREDAQLEQQRAQADQAEHETFVNWLETEDFPKELRDVAKQIGDRFAGRIAAAQQRLNNADLLLADVQHAKELLAPHDAIRGERAAAGGMAKRTAYAI